MLKWLRRKGDFQLKVDIHNHLIPGVDDGVQDISETLDVLRNYQSLGFEKVVTTPHIYSERYPNSEEQLVQVHDRVIKEMNISGLGIKLDLAAEYYCDGVFLDKIKRKTNLLSFHDNHVLVETGFHTKSLLLDEIFFELMARGYTPVLAHPERYQFLEKDLSWLESIRENGVLLQVNLPSLIGVYGPAAKQVARQLLKKEWVAYVGSDLHKLKQWPVFQKALKKLGDAGEIKNNNLL